MGIAAIHSYRLVFVPAKGCYLLISIVMVDLVAKPNAMSQRTEAW